ncbi:MAG: DivIVA domain-containing protein [Methylocystaceae bacterium]
MLTPVEIRGYQFKGKMGGYQKEDVDSFVNKVVGDYESLYSENQLLKEKTIKLEFEISRYRKLEESVNQTLVVAQKAADDLKSQAVKEAELTIRQARQQVAELLGVYEDVVKRTQFLIAQVKGLLQAETELLNGNEDRIKTMFDQWSQEDIAGLKADLSKSLEIKN